jgi:hypothetical protein
MRENPDWIPSGDSSEPSTSARRPTKSLTQCATWTKLTLHRVSRFRNYGTSPLSHMLLWHRSSERAATISTTTDKLKELHRSAPPHKPRNLLNKSATLFHFTSSAIYWREVRSIHTVRHPRCVFINYNWINQLSNTTIWWLDICHLLHR